MVSAGRKAADFAAARSGVLARALFMALCLSIIAVVVHDKHAVAPRPETPDPSGKSYAFALLVRTLDPKGALPATLDHYASCSDAGTYITTVRVVREKPELKGLGVWSLQDAKRALEGRHLTPDEHDRIALAKIAAGRLSGRSTFLWSLVLAESQGRLRRKGMPEGALLVSDDVWIDCRQLASAFREWKRHHGRRIVGTSPKSHEFAAQTSEIGALVYKYVPSPRPDGAYSMVALDGALVRADYFLRGDGSQISGEPASSSFPDPHLQAAVCDEIAINIHATKKTGLPPVYVAGRVIRVLGTTDTAVARYGEQLVRAGDACLLRLSDQYGGKLPLLWSESSVVDVGSRASQHPSLPSSAATNNPSAAAAAVAAAAPAVDVGPLARELGGYRPFQAKENNGAILYDDATAAASAVIVMENGPDDVALAVRFLRARYPFIQEVVVWNNANETMNHHMLPYDLAVRYVMAGHDYSAFGKYLGCLIARHEICYFQHERARPDNLRALHTMFLSRPDAVVTSAEMSAALGWRRGLTFAGTGLGRSSGYADLTGGSFAHKETVRKFVNMVRVSASNASASDLAVARDGPKVGYRGSHTDPKVADADFVFSLDKPALVLALAREPVLDNRPPSPRHPADVLATSLRWAALTTFGGEEIMAAAASSVPGQQNVNGTLKLALLNVEAPMYHRTPCPDDTCVFMTSVDAWPPPKMFDFGDVGVVTVSAIAAAAESSREAAASEIDAISYHHAVDGDLSTVWAPPSAKEQRQDQEIAFVGLELTSDDARIVGVDLWLVAASPSEEAAALPAPRLQFLHLGQASYRSATECTVVARRVSSGSGSASDLVHFTYTCPVAAVRRLRLVSEARHLRVAELRAIPLRSRPEQKKADDASSAPAAVGTALSLPAASATRASSPPPIKVAYVIQDSLAAKPFSTTTLAMLEEACELGARHPGRVTLVYAGPSTPVTMKDIAEHFSVVGSVRSLHDCLNFEAVAQKEGTGRGGNGVDSLPPAQALAKRRREFHKWWNARSAASEFAVVFYDPHETPLLPVIREKRASAATMFSARVHDASTLDEEAVTLADSALFASKDLFLAAARQAVDWRQDRRILYPLRTIVQTPEYVLEPTVPAVEEVLVVVTGATLAGELSMFYTHALPVLQEKATIKLVNLTAMAHKAARIEGMAADVDVPLDELMRAPRWRTLFDLVYYASIYPARVLWILDSSVGASYYASAASSQGVRFVASPGAVPHYERRLVAWNSTCHWSGAGFSHKARELVRGDFALASGFKEELASEAGPSAGFGDCVIEEWPIRREMHPFVNTASSISRYVGELVVMSRRQREEA